MGHGRRRGGRPARRATAQARASGGASLDTIRKIAETGVDFISVDSVPQNVHAIDLSMRFEW